YLDDEISDAESVEAKIIDPCGSSVSVPIRSDSNPHKIRKSETLTLDIDRLSSLPDSLILEILSLLPIKEAISTSILSKRWRFLWHDLPILTFRSSSFRIYPLVDKTLGFHKTPKLQAFRANLWYNGKYASNVDAWIRFALGKSVERLDLKLPLFKYLRDDDNKNYKKYSLPSILFRNSSIRTMRLKSFQIGTRGLVINWKCLKNLHLCDAHLENRVVGSILSGSPVLECLELKDCSGFSQLDLKSKSLRKLVLNGYDGGELMNYATVLEIVAPDIRSLVIGGQFSWKRFRVVNVGSLVDAKLDFGLCVEQMDVERDCLDMVSQLLKALCHVEKLHIGSWCIQVLSVFKLRNLPSPPSRWRWLCLTTDLDKWDLPGVISSLECANDVDTIVLDLASRGNRQVGFIKNFNFEKRNAYCHHLANKVYCTPSIELVGSLLLHLKTVEVVGFGAEETEIEFIHFVLKNAKVLGKMIICTRERRSLGPVELFELVHSNGALESRAEVKIKLFHTLGNSKLDPVHSLRLIKTDVFCDVGVQNSIQVVNKLMIRGATDCVYGGDERQDEIEKPSGELLIPSSSLFMSSMVG
ncbi:F-box domain, partial [Dillenia turbinata]